MRTTKKAKARFHVGDWVKFHYGPKKVTAKIVEDRGPLAIQGGRLYRVQLGDETGEAPTFEVPESELEAERPPVRLSYEVKYFRPDNTNVWHASISKGAVLKGVQARGAVGYTTAFRGEATADDQRYAAIDVLLEVDPYFDDACFAGSPSLAHEFASRANALADEVFLSRHPRAKLQRITGQRESAPAGDEKG